MLMTAYILVEVGVEEETRATLYQFYERAGKGTYKLAKELPDDGDNEPMTYKVAHQRQAIFHTKARAIVRGL